MTDTIQRAVASVGTVRLDTPRPEAVAALQRQVEQLQLALETRDVIGQAKGILMERFRITADEAFDLLRVASQHRNRKLNALAADLAATGEWPVPGAPS